MRQLEFRYDLPDCVRREVNKYMACCTVKDSNGAWHVVPWPCPPDHQVPEHVWELLPEWVRPPRTKTMDLLAELTRRMKERG